MTIPTGRESDKFMLRLPDGMRDMIKTSAAESGRSMNQEIVDALTEFFPVPPTEEDILFELKRLSQLVEDIGNGGKRYHIHSSLRQISDRLVKTTSRSGPAVLLPQKIINRIEALSEKHDVPRDTMAKYLIIMGIVALEESGGYLRLPRWSLDELD